MKTECRILKCIILIRIPEQKREPEFPGIAERKIGLKNDFKI
jgi:hypothetical protein